MMPYRYLRLSTNLKVEIFYKDFPNKRVPVVVFVIIAQILNVYVCFQVLNFSLTFSEPILDLVSAWSVVDLFQCTNVFFSVVCLRALSIPKMSSALCWCEKYRVFRLFFYIFFLNGNFCHSTLKHCDS